MEHDFLKKGVRGIRDMRLSPEEKQAVFARLIEHVEAHPASIVSPWRIYISHFNFRYAIAGLLIMVLTGGSVVSAAEGTLPGDLLYSVKLSITEPLQGIFISGDVPKAHWEAEKTVRRLEEAEMLATKGRLNRGSVQIIKENFEKSANAFDTIVQRAEANASTTELVDARFDFEVNVNAHARILLRVASSSSLSEQDDIAPLTEAVAKHMQKAEENARERSSERRSKSQKQEKGD